MNSEKYLKLTLIKSKFGRNPKHTSCIKGLGLKKIRQSVVVANNSCNRGLVSKISYLLKVEEV